jgi:hypothetical protein
MQARGAGRVRSNFELVQRDNLPVFAFRGSLLGGAR